MTKSSPNEIIKVSHFVGLSGLGGVQRNFVEYINSQSDLDNGLLHKVYTLGKVDLQYKILAEVYNVKNLKNLFSLVLDIVSKDNIVHFYNNLTSLKVAVFLFLLPVNNLILHERGTIWNFPSSRKMLLKFVAWKAHLILANSNATKTMLEQKFSIPSEKIKVLHNGIYVPTKHTKKITRDSSTLFRLGFIGRLDTPKGVHVLIDAMRILGGNDIKLIIAGDGALEDNLKEQAYNIENISFIGRVAEPSSFLNSIDLLVVPSIREPLGNVCLEAGLCKVPVLAANIDGLPEIIEDKISGELIDATDEVSVQLSKGSVSLPEFVVDPISNQLRPPKQINPSLLARKILKLSLEPDNLKHYAEKLHDKVVKYFNIQRYGKELHTIYYEIKQKKTSSKKTS